LQAVRHIFLINSDKATTKLFFLFYLFILLLQLLLFC